MRIALVFHEGNQYREAAIEAATEAGWGVALAKTVEGAEARLETAKAIYDIDAVVFGSLGAEADISPSLRELWAHAGSLALPGALIAEPSEATQRLTTAKADTVIPRAPYEDIAPRLHAWFVGLR